MDEADLAEVKTDFLRIEGQVRKGRLGLIAGLLALLAAVAGFFVYRLWRSRRAEPGDGRTSAVLIPPPEGLTEAEAAARLDPEREEDNLISSRPPVSRSKIIRGTIFNIFNLNLIVLGTIQIAFVRPLDGLITLGIIIVNVVANVLQYEISRRRLKEIREDTRPLVTVMRDGKARSVDPREIVIGDVITAGRGDQIIADGPLVGEGQLLLDETMLGSGGGSVRKRSGDQLLAGSICLNGRAAYHADVLGDERQVIQYLRSLPEPEQELTAIEKILNRVMRMMLVIMLALAAYALLRLLQMDLIGSLSAEAIDPLIVILNLAPASLFFMVVLTYVSSTADLAKIGALVKQSRSVESLAQLDVLCLAKAGFLTGIGVDLQPITPADEEQALAPARIRQIVGDFAHNLAGASPAVQALAANFPGSKRVATESAPFLSAYGWSGIIFDDVDLQGLYVLAEPELLALDLAAHDQQEEEAEAEEEEGRSLARSLTSIVRKPFARFGRRNEDEQHENLLESEAPGSTPVEEEATASAEPVQPAQPQKKGLFGRLTSTVRSTAGSVGSLIRRDKEEAAEAEQQKELEDEASRTLIFAYNEQVTRLDLSGGEWQLPQGLTPLCQLRFEEKVRPEARDSINIFSERGVAVKIFTAGESHETAARLREAGVTLREAGVTLREAGVTLREDPQLTAIDAPELEGLDTAELGQIAATNTVFGSLSPQKAAEIIHALLDSGFSVGMAGHGVNDVAALRAADLAIVRKDSSPAVLDLGDIVLLDQDPSTFTRVLEKGQRIVMGLIDILKLYITQMFYLLFLILAIPLLLTGFPYTSAQAGLIALITLTIPALALTLWASTGKLPRARLSKILLNFVAPAALAIALLGYMVYAIVLQQGGSVEYAQNVLTYAMVAMGLMLVITIKPPIYLHVTSLPQKGDIRPTIMVVISVIVFVIIARIPFLSEIFKLAPLQNPTDYMLIFGSALVFLIVVNLFWWLFPVATKVGGQVVDVGEELVESGAEVGSSVIQ